MPLRFTLRQIEYLIAVADAGSVALAAERLHVSSPSISTAISQLEADFGLQLFIRRHAQGLSLTEGGRRFVETARTILALHANPPELITDLFLREIDYGPDENRPEDAVIARIGKPALDAWEKDSIVPPGWRVDPDALIGNWQETFHDLRDEPGDHLIVTSNGIARFALAAAGAVRQDPKLKTGAWGVVEVTGQDVSVLAWNVRPESA